MLVQILAITSIEQSIGTNIGWIFLSQGRTDVLFKLSIFTASIIVISFAVGLRWGVEGVGIAYNSDLLDGLPCFCNRISIDRHGVTYLFSKLWSVTLAALLLGIVAFFLRISLEKLGVTQDLTILAFATAASLLTYSVSLFLLDKQLFIGIVQLLDQLRSADSELT